MPCDKRRTPPPPWPSPEALDRAAAKQAARDSELAHAGSGTITEAVHEGELAAASAIAVTALHAAYRRIGFAQAAHNGPNLPEYVAQMHREARADLRRLGAALGVELEP